MEDNILKNLKARLVSFREDPSAKTWPRLERRLDQDRGKIHISRLFRYLYIAASVGVIVVVAVWVLQDQESFDSLQSDKITTIGSSQEFAVYQHAPKTNEWYNLHDWSSIYEGDVGKQFLVTTNQLLKLDESTGSRPVEEDSVIQ